MNVQALFFCFLCFLTPWLLVCWPFWTGEEAVVAAVAGADAPESEAADRASMWARACSSGSHIRRMFSAIYTATVSVSTQHPSLLHRFLFFWFCQGLYLPADLVRAVVGVRHVGCLQLALVSGD